MMVWLDDERPAPPGWVHVKTANEAISLLRTGKVERISLDHDLGETEGWADVGNGYQVACWIEEAASNGSLSEVSCSVHSANPVGREKMKAALRKAYEAWRNNDV